MDELAAQVGRPPRDVWPLTRVRGHIVTKPSDLGSRICECGWRVERATEEDVAEHLRNAWPILVPRLSGESLREWRNRVADEHNATLEALAALGADSASGLAPGEPIPFVSSEWLEVNERAEVLQTQLDTFPSLLD